MAQPPRHIPPLKPVPPLPPLSQQRARTRRRLLSWATVLAIAGAIALGVFHGLGARLADEIWAYLARFLGW